MAAASSPASPDARARAALRALPRVDDLLASEPVARAAAGVPHALALEAARACLDGERGRILSGLPARDARALEEEAAERALAASTGRLRRVVNATGVVLHTNLGRAPLDARVAERVAEVAAHYSTVEFDLESGARGSRHDLVAGLLCRLTGAEDAAVVNNNAAAVMLVLAELARGREAVVSRGELIEIGGSFRIPDIMETSGARMVEVGTTNKTHLADFERAITPDTAMVLKVHTSNYRVVGFHEEVDVRDLAALAHSRGVLVYEDQGSGSIAELSGVVGPGERTPAWSLREGVDLVSFSGDKLLGAGQAGIVVGRRALVSRIKKNPLMRALRPDKMTLAALEGTLRLYLDEGEAWERVPVLRMLKASPDELRARAWRLLGELAGRLGAAWPGEASLAEGGQAELRAGAAELAVVPAASAPGGGSLPTVELPSWCLSVRVDGAGPDELRAGLLSARPCPVVARVADGALLCDVRTLVDRRDEEDLVAALAGIVGARAERSADGR